MTYNLDIAKQAIDRLNFLSIKPMTWAFYTSATPEVTRLLKLLRRLGDDPNIKKMMLGAIT